MNTRSSAASAALLLALLAACSSTAPGTPVAESPLENSIAPGENLVIEGIPPIPRSLADAVGRYGEFRQAFFAGWHPTKRELLVVTRFGDTYQVHQVAMPGGARRQLTFFRENVFSGIQIDPEAGAFFTFLKDVGGDENFQLYRYDMADGESTLLSDGRSRNTSVRISHSGQRLVYSSNHRNPDDMDLWLVDPRDARSSRLLSELQGGAFEALEWSPDDSQVLVLEGLSINESYLWLVDAASGAKTRLTEKGAEQVSWSDAHFAKDGQGLYVATDQGSEFQRLAYLDLATKQLTFLASDIPWDVEGLDVSPDGKTVAFVVDEDGISSLHLLDTATRSELAAPRLPAGVVSGIRWHPDGKELGLTLESARNPADAWSANVTTGEVTRWTFSETGGLDASTFAEAEPIHWKSFDGLSIAGFLYRPPKSFAGKRPVIVDIHGGPEGQYRPGFLGSDNYFLDKLGVAQIYPNVRGSSGYGKTFLKLDNGFRRMDSVADISALLDWIRAQPDLDPERVMVRGGSYGGFMTLAVATSYDERIRCSLDVVGPSNFVTFLENTSGYRRDLRRVEYGDETDPAMREFLLGIAPVRNARKITKPLFVVQGKNDPRVPATESEQMVATVRENGTPVWYLMAKDEGHGFAKKTNLDYLLWASAAFVNEHLLK